MSTWSLKRKIVARYRDETCRFCQHRFAFYTKEIGKTDTRRSCRVQ